MGPIEPIGIEPIGPSPPVPRSLRVTRDRREREPGDEDRHRSPDAPEEPALDDEPEDDGRGHVDVTV